jgi:hypothetical protein
LSAFPRDTAECHKTISHHCQSLGWALNPKSL